MTIGCDPKFFFGESVDKENFSSEGMMFIPDIDLNCPDPADETIEFVQRSRPLSPLPPAVVPPNEQQHWYKGESSVHNKYVPSQGPWGIIPSRSVMITNLPKTTQLWTLFELLKVVLHYSLLTEGSWREDWYTYGHNFQ